MDRFLKNATVVRVVDGQRVDVGPIARSKFSEHVTKRDSFGNVPQRDTVSGKGQKRTIESISDGAKNDVGVEQGGSVKKRVVVAKKKGIDEKGDEEARKQSGKGVATNLGTIEHASTVNEVMAIRMKEVDDHEQTMRSLYQKLNEVEEQLSEMPRTRGNIAAYKRLIERRDAVRAEIVRKRGTVPTLAQMTMQMIQFYEERENPRKKRAVEDGRGGTASAAVASADVELAAPLLLASATASTAGISRGGAGAPMAIQFNDVGTARIAEVTFGTPIIEMHEYERLETMLRVKKRPQQDNSEASAASSNRQEVKNKEEETHFCQENALADIDRAFDEAIRADITTNAAKEVLVVAYLISPLTRGWAAVEEEDAAEVERNAKANKEGHTAAEVGKRLLATAANKVSTTSVSSIGASSGKNGLEMTKIGSNRGHVPTGSKIRNRLNIKNKDIRNSENSVITQFCTVQKRKRSDQERETIEFVRYVGSTHFNDVDAGMTYEDPLCENCGSVLDIDMHTGMETCTDCGLAVYGKMGREIVPLEQPMHNKYQYLKVGHMKTILKRSQGKETTRIPPKVPNDVTRQLKMERANFDEVDAFRVKKTLKKLGYSKWYDHMHQITQIVTGRPPQQFSQFEEELILSIFEHLVEPYERHRPQNQENFPYYYYALHKICQLLGYPKSVLRNFPILQNVAKHRQKETVWKKMMADLGWTYYPS